MSWLRPGAWELSNLLSLAAIQLASALLPLVVFPYVLGVVGTAPYAKLVLAEAVSLFGLTLVLYSFEIDGVARIVGSRSRVDTAEASRVFSAILYLRLLIFAACVALLLLCAPLLGRESALLLLGWMLLPLSYALQSSWLFQGMEKNFPLAAVVVPSKLLAMAAVFVAVETPADYQRVPWIVGLFSLGGALLALGYAVKALGVRLCAVSVDEMRQLLRSGREIFVGNLAVMLYRDVNVLLLGLIGAGQSAIAAYSIAEKVTKCVQAGARPFNQLFFPKALTALGDLKRPSPEALRRILGLVYPQQFALAGLVVVLFLVYYALLPRFEALESFPQRHVIEVYVSVMVPAVFLGVANFMLGTAGLNALQARGFYLKVILLTGVASVVACVVLALLAGGVGAAVSFVFAEALLLCLIIRRFVRAPEPSDPAGLHR